MAKGITNSGGGGLNKSVIIVTDLPTGSTVTAIKGDVVKTSREKNGEWWFKNLDLGEWTLKATLGDQSAITTYNIEQFGVYRVPMSYIKIYGIMRDITNSSPAWERTDDAVGLTATASVGTVPGHSDFDTCYPWSEIKRETLGTGDVMVKIPKFWYQRYRDGNIEYIKIADKPTSGFELHPVFNHGNVESEYIYIGAYKTSNNNKSVSNATPTVNMSRTTFRNNAKWKGAGWNLIDVAALSAVQMLILVEFANNNVQAVIGRGYCDNNRAVIKTGSCNDVSNLTGRPAGTDGKVDVVWRGIEGFWGNVWEWVDGVNWKSRTYYVCNTPSNYADDTDANYDALSFESPTTNEGYIEQEGLDNTTNKHIMFPFALGGSSSTYYCDFASFSAQSDVWKAAFRGGNYEDGPNCGLFRDYFYYGASIQNNSVGSRLMYIPQEAL